MWMNVDRGSEPNEWVRLDAFDIATDDDAGFPCPSHDNTLSDWDDEDDCGNGALNFSGPTYTFYVANNLPFTLKFHGYDQDCFDSVRASRTTCWHSLVGSLTATPTR